MDQKYLPIPIADPIYNFVQIFYLSVHNFTALGPIFLADIADIPITDTIIDATLMLSRVIPVEF